MTNETNKNETADNTAMAAGIIRTVQHVLRDTAGSREALPPGFAGSMGMMLCVAMDLLPCPVRGAVKTSLGDVAHILGTAFREKTAVSPTVASALSDIIGNATGKVSLPEPGAVDECGRQYVAAIQPPPDVAAAGIARIELWAEKAPVGLEALDAMRAEAVAAARRGAEIGKALDHLRRESDSLMDLVKNGALRDEAARGQVLRRIADLIRRTGVLKKDVDGLPGGKPAPAERVPDWRDGASTAEKVSGSARTRGDATGTADQLHGGKPVAEGKPSANTPDTAFGKRIDLSPSADKSSKPAAKAPKPKTPKEDVKPDGTAEVAGFFTPEETGELIEKIRAWLENCRDGHRLSDLMESIRLQFELSDPQLGELLGISDRLVCHVRHGRKSPFALARFTEVFGTAGGAKEG